VIGQLFRYIGFIREELAEPDQPVRGVVITLEDDQRLRRVLAMVPTIEFYRYEVSFKLMKVVMVNGYNCRGHIRTPMKIWVPTFFKV
jgi:hypothetical protein